MALVSIISGTKPKIAILEKGELFQLPKLPAPATEQLHSAGEFRQLHSGTAHSTTLGCDLDPHGQRWRSLQADRKSPRSFECELDYDQNKFHRVEVTSSKVGYRSREQKVKVQILNILEVTLQSPVFPTDFIFSTAKPGDFLVNSPILSPIRP